MGVNQAKLIYQKATFLNFMVMHIRKPENKRLYLGSNENKNLEKCWNKIEARFPEGE